MLNTILEQEFASYLMPNERLLWVGKPQNYSTLSKNILFFLGGLIVLAFFAFLIYTHQELEKASDIEILFVTSTPFTFTILSFGLIFFIGILMSYLAYLEDTKKENTFYGITETRIIICKKLRITQITSLEIKKIPVLHLLEQADRNSSIRLGNNEISGSGKHQHTIYAPCLHKIEDATTVYQLLLKQQKA